MRTTFSKMCLLNNDLSWMAHLLYSTEKSRASAKTERERVRGREWVKKGCSEGHIETE